MNTGGAIVILSRLAPNELVRRTRPLSRRSVTGGQTGSQAAAAAAEKQNVASRGAFEIHMARVHRPGRGPAWKSFQISTKGAFAFRLL